eukprot:jgi/Bigna1/144738/aug1.91_g19446
MIDQVLQKRSAVKLQIEGLDAPSMNMMLCQQLNVKKIPDPVLNFIVHRAHCNPFVASEILGALRAKGVISVSSSNDNADDGKVKFDETEDLERLQLPRSIKDLITMRLDNLPNHELLVCKLASIFGITVPKGGLEFVWLKEGYPPEKLWPALISLEQKGIMHQPSASEYSFTQPLVAEACIDTILYERRARIHLMISKYYTYRMRSEQARLENAAASSSLHVSPSAKVRKASMDFAPLLEAAAGTDDVRELRHHHENSGSKEEVNDSPAVPFPSSPDEKTNQDANSSKTEGRNKNIDTKTTAPISIPTEGEQKTKQQQQQRNASPSSITTTNPLTSVSSSQQQQKSTPDEYNEPNDDLNIIPRINSNSSVGSSSGNNARLNGLLSYNLKQQRNSPKRKQNKSHRRGV